MTLFPVLFLGIVFAFLLIGINHFLVRTNLVNYKITPKNHLKASMIFTYILSVVFSAADRSLTTSTIFLLLFAGFQIMCVVTSYLVTEDTRSGSGDR